MEAEIRNLIHILPLKVIRNPWASLFVQMEWIKTLLFWVLWTRELLRMPLQVPRTRQMLTDTATSSSDHTRDLLYMRPFLPWTFSVCKNTWIIEFFYQNRTQLHFTQSLWLGLPFTVSFTLSLFFLFVFKIRFSTWNTHELFTLSSLPSKTLGQKLGKQRETEKCFIFFHLSQ